VFTVPDDVAEAAPVRSAGAAPTRQRRFKAKKKSSQSGVMIAIIAASILLIAGAAIGGYFLLKSKRGGGATAQKRPTPTGIQTGINVGELAQDISAEDLDGVTFKLSDYRGKVVILDFWGHW